MLLLDFMEDSNDRTQASQWAEARQAMPGAAGGILTLLLLPPLSSPPHPPPPPLPPGQEP